MGVIDLTFKPLKVIDTPVNSNSSFTQSFTTELAVTSGEPSPLFITDEVVIKAGKGLLIYTTVNCEALMSGTGASPCSIAINIKVDGQWCSLGNSGYVVTAPTYNRGIVENYVAIRHVPFSTISKAVGVIASNSYTLQVDLVMKLKKSNSIVVVNNDNQNIGGNVGSIGHIYPEGALQNHTTIQIEETD